MRNQAICGVASFFFVAGSSYGSIFAPASLADLAQAADLIVVGSASGGLQVARVLKGDPTITGTNIDVDFKFTPVSVNGNGLWFLKRSPSGWKVIPIQDDGMFGHIFIPEPPGPVLDAYAYNATASLAEKVASEVSAAIESSSDPAQFSIIYYGLDQLNSPVIQRLYTRLSTSDTMRLKILGLSGLIRGGSTSALTVVAQSAASLDNYSLEYGVLSNSVSNDFRATDANSVQVLGQIATGSTGAGILLREAAALALRAIHTKEALPYLAAFLDDPDAGVRAEGIGGMSAFANGLPVQTPANVVSMAYLKYPASAPFQTAETLANFAMGAESIGRNETGYLSFWKTWWMQNRAALGY
jgi:hypothetical protein